MSQEWFDPEKPFYLLQILFPGKTEEVIKVRQFIYADKISINSRIQLTVPGCIYYLIHFPRTGASGKVIEVGTT